MVTFDHRETGTPESSWRSQWRADRRLDLDALFDGRPPARLILLAAHPDDETLGAGGLLNRLCAELQIPVDIVVATAGEASHPDSPTYSRGELARMRKRELQHAVQLLAPGARIHFLDLPDGAVTAPPVAAALQRLVIPERDRVLLVAPWHCDGHPDHEAAGEAARSVAEEYGLALLEYPLWLWHWADPDSADVPWGAMRVLPLTDVEQRLKSAAQNTHVTQVQALSDQPGDEVLLGPKVLEHFTREFETFVLSQPVGTFERLHARSADPWGYENRFYERRKRAVSLALLPHERFTHGLELGCSIGVLSSELAERCDRLLAVDVSPSAIEQASSRLSSFDAAEAREMRIPEGWPEGRYDLIVLSETGYFLTPAQLDEVIRLTLLSLSDDGVLLLCHWRHPVEGWVLDGDSVHRAFRACRGLAVFAEHQEEDFRVDVLVRPPTVSVARRTGLL